MNLSDHDDVRNPPRTSTWAPGITRDFIGTAFYVALVAVLLAAAIEVLLD